MDRIENVYTVLSRLQRELKAPKNQYNNFGKYHYRNCEDILEAVKKIMPDDALILIDDEVKMIGDWHYVQSKASFVYKGESISSTAYAREPLCKKGFDESQITGASSSYARKYALNGLLLIDDTKDADSKDNASNGVQNVKINNVAKLKELIKTNQISQEWIDKSLSKIGVENIDNLSDAQCMSMISFIANKAVKS